MGSFAQPPVHAASPVAADGVPPPKNGTTSAHMAGMPEKVIDEAVSYATWSNATNSNAPGFFGSVRSGEYFIRHMTESAPTSLTELSREDAAALLEVMHLIERIFCSNAIHCLAEQR